YTHIPASLVIPANVGSVTVSIKPINDTADEPDETVILTLASAASYNIDAVKKTATIKIIDNDPTPAPSAAPAPPAPSAPSAPLARPLVSVASAGASAWSRLQDSVDPLP